MTDGPKEMAVEFKRHGAKVQITIVHGDRVLHSDVCDPRSELSRRRTIKKLLDRFPAIDAEEVDARLLETAIQEPPRAAANAVSAVIAETPDPWPQEVDGAALLDDLTGLLQRFVVLPMHAAEICALWILHTYVFACFEYTPRLLIHSPEKRCGKSRLLRMLFALANRALSCDGISAAALFRCIDKYALALLLDEADTYLRGRNVNEDLRGVINAGHQRGGKILRCVGDDAEPTPFNCFAPMAIAMIGKPPVTVEDRSIQVAMRRRMPGEEVERHAPGKSVRNQFIDYVRRCVRWTNDHREALAMAEPSVPKEIDDRAADCWFALLAIADRCGGRWPDMSRQMAVQAMTGRDGANGIGVQLLQDLRVLFDRDSADRMSSSGIISALTLLEERPWPTYSRGRPITPRQLARLLEPFGITPKTIRLPDSTPKGYLRGDLADAWERYLSENDATTPAPSATTPHACGDKDLGQNRSATGSWSVADENVHNPLPGNTCGGVADERRIATENGDQRQPADQLHELVENLADDLDSIGAKAPFTSVELRRYYHDLAQQVGIAAALGDAEARYRDQLAGNVLPLRRVAS